MAKELLVNVSRGEEVRVALVEDGRLEEIYLERDSATSNVGSIYLGKVTNVEASIQAAFVDFGYGRNGFLHVQDLHPDYFPDGGRWENMTERVGKKIGRRDRPPIQDCLRRGDRIVVQIIKEGIGTKGPTLTSYPSIPGRFLVMMPGVEQMGVSKNIEDEEERRRLRKVLDGLKPPEHVGFIIRTAGLGVTKVELERDFKYLVRLHEQIESARKNAKPPTLLYSEGDLVTRTVRDVWTPDVDRVVVDDAETALRIKQFFKLLMPRTKVDVCLYQGDSPLFHAAYVEREIETMFSRHVPMEGGASLVIDSTEAIVAIDVNSGRFREHGDAEETAFAVDMMAAEEICRQLKLRDLGGVVICDFIDLRYARHRQALHEKLTELFRRDKAKSRHLEMNEFGIVAITRQRMRPDLKKSVYMPCPWSGGTGYIKTPESMALDVMRRLRVAAADERVQRIKVGLFPSVALHVLNTKRQALAELETKFETPIIIRDDDALAADEVSMELLDERDGQVQIEALQPAAVEVPDSGGKRRRGGRRRRGADRADRAGGNGQADTDDETGLIDLPDLMELGELKLDAVEALVEDIQEKEAVDKRERDPNDAILSALKAGNLFTDEAEEQAQAAKETPEASDNGEAREGGRRRRRRRRRGGSRDGAEEQVVQKQPELAEPIEEVEESDEEELAERAVTARYADEDEADDDHAVEPRVDRWTERGQRAAERSGGQQDDEAETETEAAPAASSEGEGQGGGRKRRRRRRGRRGGEDAAGEARDAQQPQRQPAKSDDESQAAQGDGDGDGNRADAQAHLMRRDPFDAAQQDQDAGEGKGGGRRRRRRRGKSRGLHGQTLPAGHAGGDDDATPAERLRQTGLADEDLDARINGNRIDRPQEAATRPSMAGQAGAATKPKSPTFYSEADDDDEHVQPLPPATPVERDDEPASMADVAAGAPEGGRRKRRRRRRRGGRGADESAATPPVVTTDEAVTDAEDAVEDETEAVQDETEIVASADDVVTTEDDEPEPLPAAVSEEAVEQAEAVADEQPAKPSRRKKAPAAKKAPKKAAKKVAKTAKAPKKVAKKAPKKAATKKAAKKVADE